MSAEEKYRKAREKIMLLREIVTLQRKKIASLQNEFLVLKPLLDPEKQLEALGLRESPFHRCWSRPHPPGFGTRRPCIFQRADCDRVCIYCGDPEEQK